MNPDIKARWVERLRARADQQGRGHLKVVSNGQAKYCCLGVLCEIAVEDGVITSWPSPRNSGLWYFGPVEHAGQVNHWTDQGAPSAGYYSCNGLPAAVIEWAGLQGQVHGMAPEILVPWRGGQQRITLINLNDTLQKDFHQIADIIEEQL